MLNIFYGCSFLNGIDENSEISDNGGFERWTDGVPDNWKTASTAGNATLTQSTTAHGGNYSVQVGGSASANKRIGYKEMKLSAGTYTVKFYAKALAAGGTLRPGVVSVSSDNKAGTYVYSDYVDNIRTGDWQLVEASLDVPAAGTYCFVVMNQKKDSAIDILIDDFTVTLGSKVVITNDVGLDDSEISIVDTIYSNNSRINSLTIPNSVTSIGNSAFYGCSGLKSIIIPNSVKTIGNYAFSGCPLKSVTIGSGVLFIGSDAFNRPAKVIWLTNTPPNGYTNAAGLVNYVANDLYTSLENKAVYPFLSSLFEEDGIKYVPVSPSERTCDAIDCVYDETAANTNIPSTVTFKGITMEVKTVKSYVCYGNKFIKSLICDYVGNIAEYTFCGCSNMSSLTLGERVMSIGQYSFQNCSSLQSVVIPDSVTQLSSYSFSGCSSLKSITLGSQVNSIGEYAFENCKILPSIKIPKAVKTISNYSFSGCTGLNTVIIADREDELKLGSNGSSPLFGSCPLDSVYIGGDITYQTSSNYGYSPFYRNTTLRTVVITDKENEISENEFYGCTNLQSFSIGDGVTKFGNWAFSGCSSLKSLSFGTQLQSIGKEAFSDCTAVTKIVSKAVIPPSCDTQALDDINKWNCQLSVPEGCLSAYQVADQWKEFFFMDEKANDEDINEKPNMKCATPTIAFIDGEFVFDCETDDVQYEYEIKCYDAQKGEGSRVAICNKYAVIVYATKPGYLDSDVATMEFTLGAGGEVCDVNQDGKVNVADITTIIVKMAGK